MLEAQFDAFADRPDLRGPAEAALANITRIDPATAPARGRGDRAHARAGRVRRPSDDPAVLGTIAAEMGMAGEPVDGDGRARRARGRRARARAPPPPRAGPGTTRSARWSSPSATTPRCAALDDALERARERGAVIDVGGVLTFRAELYVHLGDLANAEVDARTLQRDLARLRLAARRGCAAAGAGRGADRARRARRGRARPLGGPLRRARDGAEVYTNLLVLLARGRLRLAQGRVRRGGRRAARVRPARATRSTTSTRPSSPWRSRARARAASSSARPPRPAAGARRARARTRVRRPARARDRALRAVGVASTDEIALLREAVAVLDASAAQLERARAHARARRRAARGRRRSTRRASRLRRRDRPRPPLRRRGAGGARRSPSCARPARGPRRRLTTGAGALTPSERRIAELAAAGQQNREIAEALFVTTATVEYHLRNAYRKLEIARARSSLTRCGRQCVSAPRHKPSPFSSKPFIDCSDDSGRQTLSPW